MDQPVDASKRGIKHGDLVRIYNDRGEVRINAKVTPRILPGVVGFKWGAGITQIVTVSTTQVALTC